jgi:DNA-directed RNA polymerase subunit M/transcription elongation factor TFIIS
MRSSSFCDECGSYISPGEEEIIIGVGTFGVVCKRCYRHHRRKSAAQAANTGQNRANRVSQVGVGVNNG